MPRSDSRSRFFPAEGCGSMGAGVGDAVGAFVGGESVCARA